MSIRRRLSHLRQTPQCTPAAAAGLAARIGRLRAVRRSDESHGSGDRSALRRALQGVEIADGVLLVEQRIASGTRHGREKLGQFARCAESFPEAAGLEPEDLLFLDTETTGLYGGSGTLAFMVGLARIEQDDLILRQYLLTRFAGEQALLNAVAAGVKAGDLLVTYNGKTFDLPLLAARCRMAGLADSLASLPHLDLLHPVRRAFAGKWDDCRLASVERQLLGFQRRDDLPGAAAPAAWFDWIRRGDGSRLAQVCRHNRWDLLSLAVLLPLLAEVYRNPCLHGADPLAVAKAHRSAGREDAALVLLLQQKPTLDQAGLTELAGLLQRRGGRQAARSIWLALSARGDHKAQERLAVHFEHDLQDYRSALSYAEAISDSDEKQRRCARLRRKLEKFNRQSDLEYG